MSVTDLNNEMPKLLAIKKEDVKEPNMPVNVYIQESDDLYEKIQDDREKLALRGITDEMINSIPPLSGSLQQAESNWQKERDKKGEASLEWEEKVKPAHELKNQILHDFAYAYRTRNDILRKLRRIRAGGSHADMIQDLSDLVTMGRDDPAKLEEMTFDMSMLDQAEDMATTLGFIYAASKAAGNNFEEMDIRNRAFTALKQVIDEIRAAGQNLFWKDTDRITIYRSEYLHKNNIKKKRKEDDDSLAA